MLSCHTGLFVDLDSGLVTTDANDLTNEIIVADFNLFKHIVNIEKNANQTECGIRRRPYQLVHGNTDHVLGDDDGTAQGLASLETRHPLAAFGGVEA